MTVSFTKLATVTASTKRSPAVSSGKIGTRTTQVASLMCTPIDPISSAQAGFEDEPVLDAHVQLFQTYCESTVDILQGDQLTANSVDYTVKSVSNWTYAGSTFLQVILIKYRK